MSYSLQNGIGNIFHEIMDPGQPPYGMMAEVRQHATQTHHLDPFNPVNGELFLEFVEGNISTVWTKIVDFVSESQIRSDEDREYLLDEEMNVVINTFSVREQIGRADYCSKWIADHQDVHNDIAYNDENDKYFSTKLPMPFDFYEIIKCLYRRYNEEHIEQIPVPLPEQISEEFDKPLFSKNQIRCDFHHEIDCDYCSMMDCYRKAYLLTHHLKYLGHLEGIEDLSNHEAESNITTTFTTFKHEKTKQAIDYERREAQRQTRLMNMGQRFEQQSHHTQPAQDIRMQGEYRGKSPVVETVSGIPVHNNEYPSDQYNHYSSENHIESQKNQSYEDHQNEYQDYYGTNYDQNEHHQNELNSKEDNDEDICDYNGQEYNSQDHFDHGYQGNLNTSFSSDDMYNGFSPRTRTSKNRHRSDESSELASAMTPVSEERVNDLNNDENLGPDGDKNFSGGSNLKKFKPRGLKFEPPRTSSRTSSATWSKRMVGRGRGCLPIAIPENLLEKDENTHSQKPVSSADNTSIVSGSRLSLGRGYRPSKY